jgi:hypothetical protein
MFPVRLLRIRLRMCMAATEAKWAAEAFIIAPACTGIAAAAVFGHVLASYTLQRCEARHRMSRFWMLSIVLSFI